MKEDFGKFVLSSVLEMAGVLRRLWEGYVCANRIVVLVNHTLNCMEFAGTRKEDRA